MDDFKQVVTEFHKEVDPVGENMLYWGFATEYSYNQAIVRESYQNAEGVLHHMKDTRVALNDALEIAYLGKLEVIGPATELTKLNQTLAPLGARFYAVDQ